MRFSKEVSEEMPVLHIARCDRCKAEIPLEYSHTSRSYEVRRTWIVAKIGYREATYCSKLCASDDLREGVTNA
jgi:hypothetical protein